MTVSIKMLRPLLQGTRGGYGEQGEGWSSGTEEISAT